MKDNLRIIVGMVAILVLLVYGVMLTAQFRQWWPTQDETTNAWPALTLNTRARVDGISHFVIQGDTARWYHILASAPGRWIEAPTILNTVEWVPLWPDVPDWSNHNCECYSSTYQGVPRIADHPPVTLEVIEARGKVTILQQPAAENDFTLIVEFDDVIYPDKTYGDEWYEINLKTKR